MSRARDAAAIPAPPLSAAAIPVYSPTKDAPTTPAPVRVPAISVGCSPFPSAVISDAMIYGAMTPIPA